jgi:hypothetical protein
LAGEDSTANLHLHLPVEIGKSLAAGSLAIRNQAILKLISRFDAAHIFIKVTDIRSGGEP